MTSAATQGIVRVEHLTKTFGAVHAVAPLSVEVGPRRVTRVRGPHGAGKTTTLRCLLGLVRPTSGTATIDGLPYTALERPGHVVGAALEASSFHPGRTARDHLRVLAPQVGVPDARCDEVLELVGLAGAANRRAGGFSLGMRQRLGLASTLLGDPQVLLLDEPANGLDPEGIAWLRQMLRYLAAEGRTVLVSSHVLSEVEQTVDDVVIIAKGRLVHSSPLAELASLVTREVRVSSPDHDGLTRLVEQWGARATAVEPGTALVRDVTAAQVGGAAFAAGLELHQLATLDVGLEQIFLRLTNGDDASAARTGTVADGMTDTVTETATDTATDTVTEGGAA